MDMGQVDLRGVLSAMGRVAEATTAQELAEATLASAVAVLGADSAVVSQFGFSGPTVRSWPDGFLSVVDQITFERIDRVEPWPLATHTRGGPGYPLRISDLISRSEYHRRTVYGELFRSLGVEHQVAFSVPVDSERLLCVAVDRKRRDFLAADVDRLDALRRPLAAGAARVGHLDRLFTDVPAAAELSSREADVLSLVASGLTNDQVGRRLGISARTVDKHLEHIYTKTGLRNRTEAAARWHRAAEPLAARRRPVWS